MSLLPFWKRNNLPVAKEAFPFIGISLLFIVVGVFFQWWVFSGFAILSLCYIILFFRNPFRVIPENPGVIVSPADGCVVDIQEVYEDRFLKEKAIKISIFMNVFNVHVNRIPFQSTVKGIYYNPGKFMNAAKEKASLENEQNALLLETPEGLKILLIQIAGLIARRIVCWTSVGEEIQRGERFGMIRFGSRVDVFLPLGVDIKVRLGEKIQGGSTILGVFHARS